jgi:hypothetical protein
MSQQFGIIKVSFEFYMAIQNDKDCSKIDEQLRIRLADKIIDYCQENNFGLSELQLNMSVEND